MRLADFWPQVDEAMQPITDLFAARKCPKHPGVTRDEYGVCTVCKCRAQR